MLDDKFYLSDEEKNEALNDDENLWTEKYLFDEKKFNTIIIEQKSQEQNTAEKKKVILDVEKFVEQYKNLKEKDDLLLWLKQNNYRHLLIEQIQTITDKEILAILIAAYWEAGFNDNKDLLIFIPHLLSEHFNVVLESSSAITGMSKPFQPELTKTAIQMIQDAYSTIPVENIALVNDVLEILKSELSTNE